ncbi:EAL domain-containing protein [Novosphingobium umbonatum]|uniref:EAL domain-containing protein n=1 Tax=Novosphingobium umbonatum TaxID=1908524 RepID=A0A437N923_9SPHN|nr:EAL domain-containing protein [Novosphingobium umbonatum]RVU06423.1 EAL domain-containing protein [Novosphingobium umbonatum]
MKSAKARQNRLMGSGLFRPVLVLAVAVFAVLALVITVMVHQFDSVSRQQQQQTAQRGYLNRFTEHTELVQQRVVSDDAVRHLAIRFDPQWAEHDLAHYYHDRNAVSDLFVLDAQDKLQFSAHNGVAIPTPAMPAPIAEAVADILPELRQAEGARPQPVPDMPLHASLLPPVQRTNITIHNGRVYMVALTLVQPDFGRAQLPARHAPVVVTAMPFDKRLLERFGARQLVTDLAIGIDLRESDERATLPLYDARGRAIAALSWHPRKPGSDLLVNLQWPLASMLLILLLLGGILLREVTRYARGLILSEAKARHLAFHDTLTQLPNRALMFERLNQMRSLSNRQSLEVAVHCLDLDRFKEVNDTLGHPAGDALIRAAARRVAELVRDTDTVARIGGDEFVILQPHTGANGASLLAERVISALSRPFDIDGNSVQIGCSVGITLISDPTAPASEIVRQADLALYSSKEKGRNCATFFEPEMDAALRMRRQMEVDLREALAQDQLHMVYQPQVDATGRIMGVEALVRWNHPTKGPIPPNVFVVLAEESGLISQLGEFTVRRVFAETREWVGLPVAINVSALQLRSPSFMAAVTRLVAENAIDARNYEFEITETVLLGDDAATRDNIIMLKQEGFTIALDDFGTGYSSLSSLQRFSVDKIKIDRAFVRNLDGGSADSVTLVEAIIKLAKALNLGVIAEGVETVSQRDCLVACGCEHFQGFLYSRPLQGDTLEQLAGSGQALGPKVAPTEDPRGLV